MSDPNQPPAEGGWAAPDPAAQQPGYQAPQPGYAPQPAYGGGQPALPGQKSRMVAGILGILLGYLGVHRFYLGYTTIGIIQIVVTIVTCGLGGLWGLIEGILILTKNENFLTDANGVPLADS